MTRQDAQPQIGPEELERFNYLRDKTNADFSTRMIKVYWLLRQGFSVPNIMHLVGLEETDFQAMVSSANADQPQNEAR